MMCPYELSAVLFCDLLTQTSAGRIRVPALAAVMRHISCRLSWVCIVVYSILTTSVCTTQFSEQAQNGNKTSFAKYCLKQVCLMSIFHYISRGLVQSNNSCQCWTGCCASCLLRAVMLRTAVSTLSH